LLNPILRLLIPVLFFSFSSNSFIHPLLSPLSSLSSLISVLYEDLMIPPSRSVGGGASTIQSSIFLITSFKRESYLSSSFNISGISNRIVLNFDIFSKDICNPFNSLPFALLNPIFPAILLISFTFESSSFVLLSASLLLKNNSTISNLPSISFLSIKGFSTHE